MNDIHHLDAEAEAGARRLLSVAFDSLPDDSLAGEKLLRQVRSRVAPARPARGRRRALVPAGAVAVLGGAAALALTLTASVAQAPSARAAVTAAAAKTSAQSFRYTSALTQVTVPASYGGGEPFRVSGVLDPRQGSGTVTSGQIADARIVHGHVYVDVATMRDFPARQFIRYESDGKPWIEGRLQPSPPPSAPPVDLFYGADRLNPTAVLGWLKSAGTVRAEGPVSGPGWTGTRYAYTGPMPSSGAPDESGKRSGTVDVDRQGHVRRLVTVLTFLYPGAGRRQDSTVITSTETFGGFGVPVKVTAPPAGQVFDEGRRYLIVNIYGIFTLWEPGQ